MKKCIVLFPACLMLLLLTLGLAGCSEEAPGRLEKLTGQFLSPSRLSSAEDLDLDTDDKSSYSFSYGEDEYHAEFLKDTWTIYDSYKIKNPEDILIICRALAEEHPVPSRDRESFRTPEDMAFEWEQHNIAYDQLPEGNHWRETSRNVDLDPDDQGKTFKEIYEERTGKELDIDTVIEHKDKIRQKVKEKLDEKDINTDDLDPERIKEKVKEKLREENINTDEMNLNEIWDKIKEKFREKNGE